MTWQIWLISHCHFFPSSTRRLNCRIVSLQCSKCVACNLNYTRTKTKTGSNSRHWNQAKFMSSQFRYFLRLYKIFNRLTALLCSILIMQQNPSERIHEELIGDFVFSLRGSPLFLPSFTYSMPNASSNSSSFLNVSIFDI